jgi:uncharacterized OB-fold protein
MSTTERTRMEPPEDPELKEFWDGTRQRELRLPTCRSCGTTFWYPRTTCPSCLGEDLDWHAASGDGTVHAVSVMARGTPYAVVLVDLDEGVRLMSNTTGVDPAAVAVGQRVRLTWESLSDGRHLWLFEPAG